MIGENQMIIIMDSNESNSNRIESMLNRNLKINACIKKYNDPGEFLVKQNYVDADLFIVNTKLKDDFDGRRLYTLQKDRFKIKPFLFLIDRDVRDEDYLFTITDYDLYNYLKTPVNEKHLIQNVKIMLSLSNAFNTYSLKSLENIKEFWGEMLKRDRELLRGINNSEEKRPIRLLGTCPAEFKRM